MDRMYDPMYDPNAPCVFCNYELLDSAPERIKGTPIEVFSMKPRDRVHPGHTLFFPLIHVEDAGQEPIITAWVMQAAAKWAKQNFSYYNIITSVGEPATQSVFHLHVHVVPRCSNDGFKLPWSV